MQEGPRPPAMRLFRQTSLEDLPVSIAGIKLGDRVLMLGCHDPKLIARLASKTGLTGRACVVDEDAARTARAAGTALGEGALIETITAPWTALPLDSGAFDVTIARDALATLPCGRRGGLLGEVLRVLRAGGRCLVIESVPRGGLGALLARRPADPDYAATRALEAAGFRAVRTVAQRDGLLFVEGVKANLSKE